MSSSDCSSEECSQYSECYEEDTNSIKCGDASFEEDINEIHTFNEYDKKCMDFDYTKLDDNLNIDKDVFAYIKHNMTEMSFDGNYGYTDKLVFNHDLIYFLRSFKNGSLALPQRLIPRDLLTFFFASTLFVIF